MRRSRLHKSGGWCRRRRRSRWSPGRAETLPSMTSAFALFFRPSACPSLLATRYTTRYTTTSPRRLNHLLNTLALHRPNRTPSSDPLSIAIMDNASVFTLASTAWLALQSLPLLFTPKVIISLIAEADEHVSTTTEVYLARLLACAQLSIIAFTLLPPTTSSQQQAPPYALTFTHVSSFVYIYSHYTKLYVLATHRSQLSWTAFPLNHLPALTSIIDTPHRTSALTSTSPNTTGLILGLIGYGILSSIGIFVCVFAGTVSHVSKRTGADKRTSGWPFGNVSLLSFFFFASFSLWRCGLLVKPRGHSGVEVLY